MKQKKSDGITIRPEMIKEFEGLLWERENSHATIKKYLRDIKTFMDYLGRENVISKERLLSYKEWLQQNYSITSVNSMLAALNQFLSFIGLGRLRLKRVKTQNVAVGAVGRELTKKEFQCLLRSAKSSGNEQLALLMETVCATGIRISELKFFRVENVHSGMVKIHNKGKYRIIPIPRILQKKLLIYIRKNRILSGSVFRTRTGKEKDRSNIWREMKKTAQSAGVDPAKVFPHNLRHLFARTFYKKTKNLIDLADILGHSSVEVTRIYTSNGFEEWKKGVEQINLLEI